MKAIAVESQKGRQPGSLTRTPLGHSTPTFFSSVPTFWTPLTRDQHTRAHWYRAKTPEQAQGTPEMSSGDINLKLYVCPTDM